MRISDAEYDAMRAVCPPVLLDPDLLKLRYACKPASMATQLGVLWPKDRPTEADYLRIGRLAYGDPHLRQLIIYPTEIARSVWVNEIAPPLVQAAIARVSSFVFFHTNFFNCSEPKGGLGDV